MAPLTCHHSAPDPVPPVSTNSGMGSPLDPTSLTTGSQDPQTTDLLPHRTTRSHQTIWRRRQPLALTPVTWGACLPRLLHPARRSMRHGPHLRLHPVHIRPVRQALTATTTTPQHQHLKISLSASAYDSTSLRPSRTTNELPMPTHQHRLPRDKRGRIPWQNPRLPIPSGMPIPIALLTLITRAGIFVCATGRKPNPEDKGC